MVLSLSMLTLSIITGIHFEMNVYIDMSLEKEVKIRYNPTQQIITMVMYYH